MSDEKQDFYYLRLSKEDGDIEAMISRELLKNPKLYESYQKMCSLFQVPSNIFHRML